MPTGRPSEYNTEVTDIICERIANGESLRSICDDPALPAQATIFKWLARYPDFVERYTRARETQADAIFDEILNIADDGRNDWMLKNFGDEERWVENGEALRRSQLRIDARKWMAGKLRPKKYGERIEHEVKATITHAQMTDEELEAIATASRG